MASVEDVFILRCREEAFNAERVALLLDQLRTSLASSFQPYIVAVVGEARRCSRQLLDLSVQGQICRPRLSRLLDDIDILLPCLRCTLKEIESYCADRNLSREIRWRKMYNKMKEEAGGMSLPQRFFLYNDFIMGLTRLLIKSPDFNPNFHEYQRKQMLQLRELRGIPAPPRQLGPPERQITLHPTMARDLNAHWAEQIFSAPLPSRTVMSHEPSTFLPGPWYSYCPKKLPPRHKLLFRLNFERDGLIVTVFINQEDLAPWILVRTNMGNSEWHTLQGAHALCIFRNRNAIDLKRWEPAEKSSKLWVRLLFDTWEEMILFYCSFLALKAHSPCTMRMNPEEYKVYGESRLFQAQIIDDGFKHSLIVYQDGSTRRFRLLASVWQGELRQCPVWTAFVAHSSTSSSIPWIRRPSRHRIWLKDLRLHVFCEDYHEESMRKRKEGYFEIYFSKQAAAARFSGLLQDTFQGISPSDSSDSEMPGPSKRRSRSTMQGRIVRSRSQSPPSDMSRSRSPSRSQFPSRGRSRGRSGSRARTRSRPRSQTESRSQSPNRSRSGSMNSRSRSRSRSWSRPRAGEYHYCRRSRGGRVLDEARD